MFVKPTAFLPFSVIPPDSSEGRQILLGGPDHGVPCMLWQGHRLCSEGMVLQKAQRREKMYGMQSPPSVRAVWDREKLRPEWHMACRRCYAKGQTCYPGLISTTQFGSNLPEETLFFFSVS